MGCSRFAVEPLSKVSDATQAKLVINDALETFEKEMKTMIEMEIQVSLSDFVDKDEVDGLGSLNSFVTIVTLSLRYCVPKRSLYPGSLYPGIKYLGQSCKSWT